MFANLRTAPWTNRSPLQLVAAPAARLVRWLTEKRVPYDFREIERFKLELELKRANVNATTRFKVM